MIDKETLLKQASRGSWIKSNMGFNFAMTGIDTDSISRTGTIHDSKDHTVSELVAIVRKSNLKNDAMELQCVEKLLPGARRVARRRRGMRTDLTGEKKKLRSRGAAGLISMKLRICFSKVEKIIKILNSKEYKQKVLSGELTISPAYIELCSVK